MGEVTVDGVPLEKHLDPERGVSYSLSSPPFGDEGEGFPYEFWLDYPYHWKISGSEEVPPFEFTIRSPAHELRIITPTRDDTVFLDRDLEIEWTGRSPEPILVSIWAATVEERRGLSGMILSFDVNNPFFPVEDTGRFTLKGSWLKNVREGTHLHIALQRKTSKRISVPDGREALAAIILSHNVLVKLEYQRKERKKFQWDPMIP